MCSRRYSRRGDGTPRAVYVEDCRRNPCRSLPSCVLNEYKKTARKITWRKPCDFLAIW
ncbi:hypothetical protein BACCAP_04546 [Pseudoflavonifractor capillosus ATCC 29799]|uniref:Uncharacterized protein n=1 Tax=Pseudoflavonifractor capillosus ATCC 29799 TaxID=411467 RepID=A6P217_9FIRM|nr:hypothetical protein BACCAP_04546 [Pseudoflavonifractor capillosus ATCC 29799]